MKTIKEFVLFVCNKKNQKPSKFMYIRVELYIQTHKLLMPINYPHLDIYNATRFKHHENDTHDIFQGYK